MSKTFLKCFPLSTCRSLGDSGTTDFEIVIPICTHKNNNINCNNSVWLINVEKEYIRGVIKPLKKL